MEPAQTVYSKTILYNSFDITELIQNGNNTVKAWLGNYKWGYTDLWCNMTEAGGPDGCRVFII